MTYFFETPTRRGLAKALAISSLGILTACGDGSSLGGAVGLTGTVDVLALNTTTANASATQGLYDPVTDTVTIAGKTYSVDRHGNLYTGLIAGGGANQVVAATTPLLLMPTSGSATYSTGTGRAFVTDAGAGTSYDVTMSATLDASFGPFGTGVDLTMSNPTGTQISGGGSLPYAGGGTITVDDMIISGATFADAPGTTVSVSDFGAGGALIASGPTVTLDALGNFAGPAANEIGVVGGVRDSASGDEALFSAIAR